MFLLSKLRSLLIWFFLFLFYLSRLVLLINDCCFSNRPRGRFTEEEEEPLLPVVVHIRLVGGRLTRICTKSSAASVLWRTDNNMIRPHLVYHVIIFRYQSSCRGGRLTSSQICGVNPNICRAQSSGVWSSSRGASGGAEPPFSCTATVQVEIRQESRWAEGTWGTWLRST